MSETDVSAWTEQNLPIVLPIFLVALWLMVTTILSALSGWYLLMLRYPDRSDAPLLQLRMQTGSMGLGVGLSGVLNLAVCASGLRVGIMRLFGPFSRDFFVPWSELRVHRRQGLLWQVAVLKFGNPAVGRLSLRAQTADRLARAAGDDWPEEGSFPPQPSREILSGILREWALGTTVAATFFIVASRWDPKAPQVPIVVAIVFPAVALGIVAVVRYVMRRLAK